MNPTEEEERYYVHPIGAFLSQDYTIIDRVDVFNFPEVDYDLAVFVCKALNLAASIQSTRGEE